MIYVHFNNDFLYILKVNTFYIIEFDYVTKIQVYFLYYGGKNV